IANQTIGIKFTMYFALSLAYEETQTVSTNELGLFTAEIGAGTPTGVGAFPTFGSIGWQGAVFNWSLQVAIDPSGGTNYQSVGPPSPIRAVPFANLAQTANVLSDSAWVSPPYQGAVYTNKNVGIGTDSPTNDLDIVGDVRIANGSEAEGRVLTSDANGKARWEALSAEGLFGQAYAGSNDGSCTDQVGGLFWDMGETEQYTRAITNAGTTVYLIEEPFLSVIDVSDPTTPLELGSVNVGPIAGTSVRLSNDAGLVHVLMNGSLQLVDVSDPSAPIIAGSIAVPGLADVEAIGDRSLVLSAAGLEVFDVSTPSSPASLGSITLGPSPVALSASGDLALVVDGTTNDLYILDITDPANMFVIDTYILNGTPSYVLLDGDRAYAGGGLLQVLDLSTPATPVPLGNVPIGSANEIAVSGDLVCTAGVLTDGVKVIDVSDPTAPVVRKTFGASSPLCFQSAITTAGNFAYAAIPCVGLKVIQLSCFSSVVLDPVTGTFQPQSGQQTAFGLAPPSDINTACAGEVGSTLINSPVKDMVREGDRVLMIEGSTLTIFDVSDPEQPLNTGGGVGLGPDPGGLTSHSGYAYVIDQTNNELQVVNISGFPSSGIESTLALGATPLAIDYADGHVLITTQAQDLFIIDVSDASSPMVVGSLALGGFFPVTIDVQGDLVFIGSTALGASLQVVDWSDPTNPAFAGPSFDLQSMNVKDLIVEGDYCYVLGYGTGIIRMLDISDPSSISQAATTTVPALASGIDKVGQFLVVTNELTGELYLVRIFFPGSGLSLEETYSVGTSLTHVVASNSLLYLADDGTPDLLIAFRLGCKTTYAYDPATGTIVEETPQWTSGNGGLFNTNPGNVGIGTNSPTAKLHVDGDLRIQDGTEGAGKVLTSDADGNASWSDAPALSSGTYNPTFSGSSGFVSIPTCACTYARTGDLVRVLCSTGAAAMNFSAGTNITLMSAPPGLPIANIQSYPVAHGTFVSDHYRNGSQTTTGVVVQQSASQVRLMMKGSNSGLASAYWDFTYRTSAP
ncbi:MAG: hypothetical protein KDC03_20730, partial [Flavobacteriales bacterium]|nr:hypothetical protein [Flavobacteriales bacterium]